ncbi:hypothetical protein FNF27_01601 [Cafeteria roenbergensis]|uniref:Uncharacterized protein n=2 Tax=Cafeteria roenbergensis TaxID=33653 RepID=A0A5A8EGS6_CAFRO|nr:hypothetical protein FNF27_01601 [Cafeteria roenbergensis]
MRLPCDSPFEWACFVALGSASWLTVNSVFAELPLFASTAPEGWGLGALLGLAIQLANVFALAYLSVRACLLPAPSAAAGGVSPASEGAYPLLGGAEVALTDGGSGAGLEMPMRDAHLALAGRQDDGEAVATVSTASLKVTSVAVFVVLLVGMAATVLLGATWSATASIGGSEHSVALLALTFLAGGVDCVSTVTFWPFAGLFPPEMTTAMAVGEGMSGVLPGLLALTQAAQAGADHAPTLSPLGFFLAMAGVLALSVAAFVVLCRRVPPPEKRAEPASPPDAELATAKPGLDGDRGATSSGARVPALGGCADAGAGVAGCDGGGSTDAPASQEHVVERRSGGTVAPASPPGAAASAFASRWARLARSVAPHARLLLLLLALSFAQNGALTALLPYACAPLDPREAPQTPSSPASQARVAWGNATAEMRSSDPGVTYRWANTAGLLADPVGALLTLAPAFVAPSAAVTGSLTFVWAAASVALVVVAVAGPGAPWGGSAGAAVFVALVYTLARLAMGLQRARLFLLARNGGFAAGGCSAAARSASPSASHRVTLYASAAVQAGACVGSVLLAVLVSSTDWFHQAENAQL